MWYNSCRLEINTVYLQCLFFSAEPQATKKSISQDHILGEEEVILAATPPANWRIKSPSFCRHDQHSRQGTTPPRRASPTITIESRRRSISPLRCCSANTLGFFFWFGLLWLGLVCFVYFYTLSVAVMSEARLGVSVSSARNVMLTSTVRRWDCSFPPKAARWNAVPLPFLSPLSLIHVHPAHDNTPSTVLSSSGKYPVVWFNYFHLQMTAIKMLTLRLIDSVP